MSSVDPVVRLLADLDRPARPSVEFQDALLARLLGQLEEAIDHEPEAQAAGRSYGWGARVLRVVTRRPGRAALAVAVVIGVAAAALFVSTPWKTGPGFLEQVQAAITPSPGSVLHVKAVIIDKIDAGCKVTWPPVEYWVDLTPPNKSRSFESTKGDICKPGTQMEIGHDGTSKQVLVFRPPNTLAPLPGFPIDPDVDPDPTANLRQAIDDGTAHHEGTTVLDGRTVERIRIDCNRARTSICYPTYTFVDPETFYPVRTVYEGGRFVTDFVTFEYLPGTPANRALADIRAQHPDAIER